jgi:T5orf172 domain
MHSYIYLIQDGYYAGTDVYKVGRTTQKDHDTRTIDRLQSYSAMTVQYALAKVDNSLVNIVEKKIIQEFNKCFTLVQGREWFSGNSCKMKDIIDRIVKESEEWVHVRNEYIEAQKKYLALKAKWGDTSINDMIPESKPMPVPISIPISIPIIKENENEISTKSVEKEKKDVTPQFQCEFCDKGFPFKKNLVYHQQHACKSLYPEKSEMNICTYCQKTLSSNRNCKVHMETCKQKPIDE